MMGKTTQRPIVFIGHSLGGLLVKEVTLLTLQSLESSAQLLILLRHFSVHTKARVIMETCIRRAMQCFSSVCPILDYDMIN